MKNIIRQSLASLFLLIIFGLPVIVLAGPVDRLNDVATNGTYAAADENSMSEIVGIIISALLSLLGVIFIVLIIYAGFNWMTAAGDSAKVDKAKDTLFRAVIGLIIVVGAYAIWGFISNILQ